MKLSDIQSISKAIGKVTARVDHLEEQVAALIVQPGGRGGPIETTLDPDPPPDNEPDLTGPELEEALRWELQKVSAELRREYPSLYGDHDHTDPA